MTRSSAQQQQLDAVVLPVEIVLEWREGAGAVSEASKAVQQAAFRRFHEGGLAWLFHLGFAPESLGLPESLEYWRVFAAAFASELARTPDLETLRHKATVQPPESEEFAAWVDNAPLLDGVEYLFADRLADLWYELNEVFRIAVREADGSVDSFLHSLRPDMELTGRVYFHLVENSKGANPFAFMATYSTQVAADGATRHLPLKNAIREFAEQRDKLLDLLSAVYRAARDSDLVTGLLDSGRIFQPLGFDTEKALRFLREVPLYERCGIRCRIPNWWTNRRSGATVSVSVGEKRPSQVGLEALTSCVPGIEIDGQPITDEEARNLLEQSQGLVLLKNKWVEVDAEKLRETLNAYEQARKCMAGGMTLREALQLVVDPDKEAGAIDAEVNVTFGEWLSEVTRKLRQPSLVREVSPAQDFRAMLRPYQQAGLNWLVFLHSLGFGACLADDMGLGKTVQVLAFLSVIRHEAEHPSLLVVPASLIGNWRDEIDRFLPDLRVLTVHSSVLGKQARAGVPDCEVRKHDLLITTYGMVHRSDWLHDREWTYAILDEAQAIKNHTTRQSRAVKKLRTRNRLMLTGTPVENRLSDLWSLFDFLNPGLLGSAKEFKETARTLNEKPDGYARLRRVINPYILRRLKTDRAIISDLPEKIEMKTYADLTRRQVVLYRDLVRTLEESLQSCDGIERKGLVLASLLKFKQICNHPDQYVGEGVFQASESGKFARLREICDTVRSKHERMLVFTQFREMIGPLDAFLAQLFGHSGVTLHGGATVKQRRERVERFQTSRDYVPYMLLSVKAGGVGLNLTRANHVVHFDRWWNPAVETQATDRAFRIGQERNVLVHKFVCTGTVEEKIDAMIEKKTAVSEQIVGANAGENWITELPDEDLKNLFSLSL